MRKAILTALALGVLVACSAKEAATNEASQAATGGEAAGADHESVPPPTVEGVTKHITAADKGGTVEVKIGEKIQVELSGVPTAGYVWAVAEAPAFLTPSGEAGGPTTTAQSEPGFAGGSHWEVFYFDVTGEGTGVLRLEQRRAWESDEPPADTFSVTVNAVAAN